MVIFCSDLDNTLIYSYRHQIGELKKCVELYEGREVSFMTHRSWELLKQITGKICFVPTTTRTVEQYERICLGMEKPEYALVCNGGLLLADGKSDREWYEESLHLADECAGELKMAGKLLEQDEYRCLEVRNIDELFLFSKSGEPEKTVDRLKHNLDLAKVDVFSNGIKVYVVPRQINKGNAIRRLKRRLGAHTLIAAGDSEFDIPMIREADYAFLPESLSGCMELRSHMTVCGGQEVFSDKMLNGILGWIRENEEP